MKEFNPEQQGIETASALEIVRTAENVDVYAAYVGLDVHKETIAVAVAEPGRGEPIYRGEIANKPKSIAKLLTKLSADYDGGYCCSATKRAHVATCSIAKSLPAVTTAKWSPPHASPRRRGSGSRMIGAMP